MSNILKNTLLIGSGFASGLVVGCFLTPKSEKERIQQLLERVEASLDELNQKSLNVRVKSGEQLHAIRDKIRKELSSPIPDLYKATEPLTLDIDDLGDV